MNESSTECKSRKTIDASNVAPHPDFVRQMSSHFMHHLS